MLECNQDLRINVESNTFVFIEIRACEMIILLKMLEGFT